MRPAARDDPRDEDLGDLGVVAYAPVREQEYVIALVRIPRSLWPQFRDFLWRGPEDGPAWIINETEGRADE